GDFLTVGVLHKYSSMPLHIDGLGRVDGGYKKTSLSSDILSISNPKKLDVSDYLIAGLSAVDYDWSANGVPTGIHKRVDASWKLKLHGDLETADVSFHESSLSLPSGSTTFVLLID